ncbi:MAG: hypothetical protein JXB35_09740 [Anaerolineae bacterium]|nr:hypothetical protein [Anaerolineae bacterium]
MKRLVMVGLTIGLLLTTLACLGFSGGGDDGFEIRVKNEGAYDICYVLISETASDSWGDDQLGDEDIIGVGDSWSINVPDEPHDVMLLDCDEAVLETAWEVDGDTTITVGGRGLVPIVVYNTSSTEICYLYISPSTNQDWGDDMLGAGESIMPTDGARVFHLSPGTYDLLAQDCDGQDLVQETEADISEETTWTISD